MRKLDINKVRKFNVSSHNSIERISYFVHVMSRFKIKCFHGVSCNVLSKIFKSNYVSFYLHFLHALYSTKYTCII